MEVLIRMNSHRGRRRTQRSHRLHHRARPLWPLCALWL